MQDDAARAALWGDLFEVAVKRAAWGVSGAWRPAPECERHTTGLGGTRRHTTTMDARRPAVSTRVHLNN